MKLVDILARELKDWPYDCSVFVSQDRDKDIAAFEYRDQKLDSNGYWCGDSYVSGSLRKLSTLAEDRDTAIVTHSEWQAAVDALGIPKFPGDAVEWNGEGLPPVGLEVEWLECNNTGWQAVTVLAYHSNAAWMTVAKRGLATVFNPVNFRPIRTPEQIATEEDLAEIERLYSEGGPAAVYDAGYRKCGS